MGDEAEVALGGVFAAVHGWGEEGRWREGFIAIGGAWGGEDCGENKTAAFDSVTSGMELHLLAYVAWDVRGKW